MKNLNSNKELIYVVGEITRKINDKQNIAIDTTVLSDKVAEIIKGSSNIIKDVLMIEQTLLTHDLVITLPTGLDKIDSRITGCFESLKEVSLLQNNPKEYVLECIERCPNNPLKAKSSFMKESLASMRYFATNKQGVGTSKEIYSLFTLREDLVRMARKEFLEQQQQAFDKYHSLQKEITKTKENKKGLER